MADVTVKRTEDFEAIFGGGFLRVRAGLGVTSFGVNLLRFPADATVPGIPIHRHQMTPNPLLTTFADDRRASRIWAREPPRSAAGQATSSPNSTAPTRSSTRRRPKPNTGRATCW